MNKKGQFGFIIVIGVILLILFLLGGISVLGFLSQIKKIPVIFWIGLIIVFFLILVGKSKK
jgi:hypothetical protein